MTILRMPHSMMTEPSDAKSIAMRGIVRSFLDGTQTPGIPLPGLRSHLPPQLPSPVPVRRVPTPVIAGEGRDGLSDLWWLPRYPSDGRSLLSIGQAPQLRHLDLDGGKRNVDRSRPDQLAPLTLDQGEPAETNVLALTGSGEDRPPLPRI